MHLLDLFESTVEGYTVTRGIDRERYQERAGLEGPFQTKSGKVVYYDAKQGQYYDPDTDMYIDHDDYRALDEADNAVEQSKIEQIVINNDIVPGIKKLMDVLAYDEATARREAEAITKHVARHRWNKMTPQERAEAIEKNKSEKSQMATDFKKVASKFGEEIDLDEGVGTYLKGAVLAGLLGLGVNQMADMASAKNSPLGQAMAQAAEQGDEYAAKHLKKLDLYMDANDTGSLKILSKRYLNKTIESVYEEVATNKRTERILGLLRAKNPTAQNDLEALILSFEKGQRQDREDINTLYTQNREEDREIAALERELERIKKRRNVSEDYYETDEQRELARLGRIIMDMGAKRDDAVGAAMGAVGNELTKYGTPQGASNMRKLEQLTGQKESVIMKMMALAQKVKGDVAVGDETAGDDDEEKVNEVLRKVPYAGYKGPGSDFRAYDEPDVAPRRTARRDESNYAVLINGKTWKVFARRATAEKAAATIERKYNKNAEVKATREPVSEGLTERDDDFDRRIHTALGGDPDKFVPHRNRPTTGDHVELKVPERYRKAQDAIMSRFSKLTGIDQSKLDVDYTTGQRTVMIDGENPHPSILSALNGTLDKLDTGEIAGLYENKNLIKDYQDMKAQGKKDHNIIDVLMSMPKYKRMSRDEMAKIIHDARRKGIFREAESPIVKMTIPNNTPDMIRKMERLAKENNVEFSKQGNTVFLKGRRIDMTTIRTTMGLAQTNIPVELVNEAESDIKIGDTVQTLKMGQMTGTVTGFSKKGGIDKVMFKHESGKVYATVPENLKVIDKVDEASRPTKMRFPGERFSKELNIQDFDLSSMYDHRSIDQLYQSLSNANSAIQKVTLKIEKLQDAGKKPVKTQQALDVLIRKRDYISDLIDQKEMQGEGVELDEAKKKPVPTKPDLWSRAKAAAKQKYDVWPSAYSSAFAAKWYKEKGGGWRMGKPKK